MPFSALLAGFALASALSVPAQDPAPPAPALEPDLGGPLVVGGVEIPPDEIKRFLIYGPGRAELEYTRVQFLIDREVERRIRENEDGRVSGKELQISELELAAALDAQAAEFARDYPTLDLETEIRRGHRSRAWYERALRQELQFDRVFLTDLIFFEQPVGTIGGPYRGPWGYYLTRVLGRKPEVRPLNLDDPRHLSLLRESWILTRFVEYAHEALRGTEVRGLEER